MFAFNENDKWESQHNFEAFAHAVRQFAKFRRMFHKFYYVYGKRLAAWNEEPCTLDMTPKTLPGCSFDFVYDGKLLMRVTVSDRNHGCYSLV